MKRALVVGIDHYPVANALNGCVKDAVEVSAMLKTNGDGSPNFDTLRLVSNEAPVTTKLLNDSIKELFSGEADIALLYFAGHGVMDDETSNAFLVTQDGSDPTWGVGLASILELANNAYPKIKSTVILLDSCHSGFAGEISGLAENGNGSHIGNGLTILTACYRDGYASEESGHGKFTDILLDGLNGAASDILGRVTPAALYAHVDQTLGAWEQRPIYKANVQAFITLREVEPKVSKDILRRLPTYFPSEDHVYNLNPSYEPDRGEEKEKLKDMPVDQGNVQIYRDLQKCNRYGLVVPCEHEHMWHSAVFSGGARLTATGAFYRRLAIKQKI